MRTYRNSLCKIVPPLKSPTITRLPFVVQSKTSPKANHHQLPLVNFSFSAKRVVFSISGSVQPLEKGQEAIGFGSGVYKYSIGYFQVFSCQSSSIPTHGTELRRDLRSTLHFSPENLRISKFHWVGIFTRQKLVSELVTQKGSQCICNDWTRFQWFSRPKYQLSPIACHTYLESLHNKAIRQFRLSGNNFSAS